MGPRNRLGSATPDVDPAVRQARMVVGLYGDSTVAWSIQLRLTLASPVGLDDVQNRWTRLAEVNPGLGRVGVVTTFDDHDAEAVVSAFACDHYGDHDPLLRVGLHDDGSTLVLAAHHGAVDGLGMLGAAGILTGLELESSARGVAPDADSSSFVLGSVKRLWEALTRPPVRLRSRHSHHGQGDLLAARDVHVGRGGSAELVWATICAVRSWNAPTHTARGAAQLVVALGLSRRPGRPMPSPDRDTAYARLLVDDVTTLEETRTRLRDTRPEPEFPQTEGMGVGPLVTKALGSRLGSTVLASNLGLIDAPGVRRIEFWPVPSGPSGVAVGLASTRGLTTVTARLRRPWFVAGDEGRFLDLVASALESAGGGSAQ